MRLLKTRDKSGTGMTLARIIPAIGNDESI